MALPSGKFRKSGKFQISKTWRPKENHGMIAEGKNGLVPNYKDIGKKNKPAS